jgi:hypothetical protein
MTRTIDEIKAYTEAATPGPWEHIPDHDKNYVELAIDAPNNPNEDYVAYFSGQGDGPASLEQAPKNALFTANAREDVPRLIKALKAVAEYLRAADHRTPTTSAAWDTVIEKFKELDIDISRRPLFGDSRE